MKDASLPYLALVEDTVPFYIEDGVVDLVAIAAAAKLGVDYDHFIADVLDAAQRKQQNG